MKKIKRKGWRKNFNGKREKKEGLMRKEKKMNYRIRMEEEKLYKEKGGNKSSRRGKFEN